MHPVIEHSWSLTPKEAIVLQRDLARMVEMIDRFEEIRTVCGLDVSYLRGERYFYAAAVVLSFPEFEVLETATARAESPFPYVPGLLSFREIPILAKALAELKQPVDLLVCDGQGMAHPRRFGLACHLGVLYDVPAIGLAKSRLIGEFTQPDRSRGKWSWLMDKEQKIGQVVRTRAGVAPLFVSPGHRVSFATARQLALQLCPRYRLPETTRLAHNAVNELRRNSTDC